MTDNAVCKHLRQLKELAVSEDEKTNIVKIDYLCAIGGVFLGCLGGVASGGLITFGGISVYTRIKNYISKRHWEKKFSQEQKEQAFIKKLLNRMSAEEKKKIIKVKRLK